MRTTEANKTRGNGHYWQVHRSAAPWCMHSESLWYCSTVQHRAWCWNLTEWCVFQRRLYRHDVVTQSTNSSNKDRDVDLATRAVAIMSRSTYDGWWSTTRRQIHDAVRDVTYAASESLPRVRCRLHKSDIQPSDGDGIIILGRRVGPNEYAWMRLRTGENNDRRCPKWHVTAVTSPQDGRYISV